VRIRLNVIIPIQRVKDADHELPGFNYAGMKTEGGLEYFLPPERLIGRERKIEGIIWLWKVFDSVISPGA
jgi:hypothetical protein